MILLVGYATKQNCSLLVGKFFHELHMEGEGHSHDYSKADYSYESDSYSSDDASLNITVLLEFLDRKFLNGNWCFYSAVRVPCGLIYYIILAQSSTGNMFCFIQRQPVVLKV